MTSDFDVYGRQNLTSEVRVRVDQAEHVGPMAWKGSETGLQSSVQPVFSGQIG